MADWGPEDRVRLYLGYLEVEMAIMGILSAFCVAAAGFVLKETMGAGAGFTAALWQVSGGYVTAGAAFLVLAALCFYRQRSELAWHHGQLCLSVQDEANSVADGQTTRELLESADGGDAWVQYQRGFAWLCAGVCELFVAVVVARHPGRILPHGRLIGVVVTIAIVLLAAVGYSIVRGSLAGLQAVAPDPARRRRGRKA